jgi:uncharacterized surface protein with fasciclin (FAS1) repeats
METLMNDTELLANTLLYHVLPSAEKDADLEDKTSHLTLLHGADVRVRHFKNVGLSTRIIRQNETTKARISALIARELLHHHVFVNLSHSDEV